MTAALPLQCRAGPSRFCLFASESSLLCVARMRGPAERLSGEFKMLCTAGAIQGARSPAISRHCAGST